MKKYLSSYPELVKEWHPTKNGDLNLYKCTHGMEKKVWWLCPKGHTYQSIIYERTRHDKPSGCPYCASKKVHKGNSLEVLYPKIAKEWHPTKNGERTSKEATYGSSKKAWWLCSKGHSYEATISNRTRMKSGCPFCAGKKASEDNNLQKHSPEIAREWHTTKNKNLIPKEVTHASHKKVWWLCPKGHSYQAVVKSRTTGTQTGCPKCSNQSSEPEVRILTELKWFFDEVKNRYKIDGVEVDIFIPSINLAIEYDGNFWHRNKKTRDLKKNNLLKNHNIHLIRVRQSPLNPLSENDIMVSKSHLLEKKNLDEIFSKIVPFVDNITKEKFKSYFSKSSFVNDELFNKYRSYFPSPFPEKSLLNTHPSIAKQWDYEKNAPLKPENFSHGANHKVWWLCSRNHSYESSINDRVRIIIKCPFCLGKKTLNYDLFKKP